MIEYILIWISDPDLVDKIKKFEKNFYDFFFLNFEFKVKILLNLKKKKRYTKTRVFLIGFKSQKPKPISKNPKLTKKFHPIY
jgi:hypothetical protein